MRIINLIRDWRLKRHRRNLVKRIKGGEDLNLGGIITVVDPGKFSIGKNVHIGEDSYFNCRGGITIGDHTVLSRRVAVYSYDHDHASGAGLPFGEAGIYKEVKIGRYVWIGMNVCIAPGTVIGDGAIIGLGTVVAGEIPPNAIVVSAKTRIIGYRDAEMTARVAKEGKFFCANLDKVAVFDDARSES